MLGSVFEHDNIKRNFLSLYFYFLELSVSNNSCRVFLSVSCIDLMSRRLHPLNLCSMSPFLFSKSSGSEFILLFLKPFVPTVAFSQLSFNIFWPRDYVSRHNGDTTGAPLKPLRDDSALRTLSSLRGSRGAPEVPPLCRETQSLGQQMLELSCENATLGKNGLIGVPAELHSDKNCCRNNFTMALSGHEQHLPLCSEDLRSMIPSTIQIKMI